MANKDLPYGFRPAKHLSGSPWNGATMKCFSGTGYATALYVGDPVVQDGTGCVRGCCPSLALVVTGTGVEILGAISSFDMPGVGCGKMVSSQPMAYTVHRAGATERYVNVVVDPDVVYMMQGDSGTVLAITSVGSNFDPIDTAHTGSAALGLSCWEIEGATEAATKTLQLWLMGFVDRNDNDISAVNADWYVLINTHSIGCGGGQGTLGRALGI